MEFRLIDRLPLSDQGAVFQLYLGRERVLQYIKKNYAEMRERKTNKENDLWLQNFEMEQFDKYVSVWKM